MRHKYTSARSAVVLLALVLILSTVLAACGGSNENTAKEGSGAPGEVTLKMILLGGKPVDYDLVFGELNKKLKEKMNATLEVEFLDWSDWNQKYPLKFAANEDFDLVYTSSWAYYNDQAIKGGFLEITEEMLQKNAPLTWEKMPKVSWDQAKINGKLYMVPNNNLEITNKVVLYREDLRKKYGLPAINSLETYANYLKTVAANEGNYCFWRKSS